MYFWKITVCWGHSSNQLVTDHQQGSTKCQTSRVCPNQALWTVVHFKNESRLWEDWRGMWWKFKETPKGHRVTQGRVRKPRPRRNGGTSGGHHETEACSAPAPGTFHPHDNEPCCHNHVRKEENKLDCLFCLPPSPFPHCCSGRRYVNVGLWRKQR